MKALDDSCVMCGAPHVPEGSMVCPECRKKYSGENNDVFNFVISTISRLRDNSLNRQKKHYIDRDELVRLIDEHGAAIKKLHGDNIGSFVDLYLESYLLAHEHIKGIVERMEVKDG